MIDFMRRVDCSNKVPGGKKAMDPMAPDKAPKFYIAGSSTPFYSHFFYLFMEHVLSVALKPLLDKALVVSREKALDIC